MLWSCLEKKGILSNYIEDIKDMYEGAKTRMRTLVGDMEDFLTNIGLHQGLGLSPPSLRLL